MRRQDDAKEEEYMIMEDTFTEITDIEITEVRDEKASLHETEVETPEVYGQEDVHLQMFVETNMDIGKIRSQMSPCQKEK